VKKLFESWRSYISEAPISLELERQAGEAFDYLTRKKAWPTDGRWDNMDWPPSEEEAQEVIEYVNNIKNSLPLRPEEEKMMGKINSFIMDLIDDGLESDVPKEFRQLVPRNASIETKRRAIKWFNGRAPGNY
jgi:hypothetical protein